MPIKIELPGIRLVDFIVVLLPSLAIYGLLAFLGIFVPVWASYCWALFGGKQLPYITQYILDVVTHSPVPLQWVGLAIMPVLFAVAWLIVCGAPSIEASVRRLLLLVTVEWCCIGFAIFASLVALMLPLMPSGSIWENRDFYVMPQIVKSFIESRGVVVYEGLPSPYSERDLFKQQMSANPTVKIRGYDFYQLPQDLLAWEKAWLGKMMTTSRPFVSYTYKNAQFHPDFILEWLDADGRKYDALICLDCREVEFIGPRVYLHCDIAAPAFDTIRSMFAEYRKNFPDAAHQ